MCTEEELVGQQCITSRPAPEVSTLSCDHRTNAWLCKIVNTLGDVGKICRPLSKLLHQKVLIKGSQLATCKLIDSHCVVGCTVARMCTKRVVQLVRVSNHPTYFATLKPHPRAARAAASYQSHDTIRTGCTATVRYCVVRTRLPVQLPRGKEAHCSVYLGLHTVTLEHVEGMPHDKRM